jgi:hypothetical protein
VVLSISSDAVARYSQHFVFFNNEIISNALFIVKILT